MNASRTARRWALAGFAVGIACMVALFIAGALTGSAPMMVVASSSAAGIGASMAAALSAMGKNIPDLS